MRNVILSAAMLFVTGCMTTGPQFVDYEAKKCERVGVSTDQNKPLVPVLSVRLTSVGGVHKHCHSALGSLATTYGCIKKVEGGYEIYHSGGDSRVHEWCHAKYGPKHLPHRLYNLR
jgi:hypothetical protein